jgi:hypothetical protein
MNNGSRQALPDPPFWIPVAPIIAGVDKFLASSDGLDKYLAPVVSRTPRDPARTIMMIVGVIGSSRHHGGRSTRGCGLYSSPRGSPASSPISSSRGASWTCALRDLGLCLASLAPRAPGGAAVTVRTTAARA